MKTARLASAAAALALLLGVCAGAGIYAGRTATAAVHALAPQMFAQKHQGVALQRAAFRQPDLLPLYGSSELTLRNPFHASALFRSYPTGFTVFPVGNVGSTSLIWLQALAAVGPDLRGKRVAVSVSARMFMDEAVEPHAYAANFSRLHANALAFSTRLSFDVKRDAARRMLRYPAPLADDPLLRFALAQLADGSLGGRALYYASLPLGVLHTALLRLQDDWETLAFVRTQLGLAPPPRHQAALDWAALARQAQRVGAGNPFGFDRDFWATHAPEIAMQKGLYASRSVEQVMDRSAEWTDLDLALRAIREAGGEALLLGIPMNGAYADYLGIPSSARQAYHERLRAVAAAHGVPLVDFAEREADRHFTIDPALHLSATGWVSYARALDAFFHRRLPDHA